MTAVRGQRLDPGVRVRRRISFAALRMTSKERTGAEDPLTEFMGINSDLSLRKIKGPQAAAANLHHSFPS